MRKKEAELGRIHNPELLVLASLASGPKHGYAMTLDIATFSGTQLEPGTLYGAITRLEAHGWIQPLPVQDRRRPYRLTTAGATVLREQLQSIERVVVTGQQRLALQPL